MLNHCDNISSNTLLPHHKNTSIKTSQHKKSQFFLCLKAIRSRLINWLVNSIIYQIIQHHERRKITVPGIYQYSQYQENGLSNLSFCPTEKDINIDIKKPVLLFIHGTISSSTHSFSDLWRASKHNYIKKLLAPYGEQVFFLDHYTISTSPVDNALTIANSFPKDTIFHIISHSRGGIVGELLNQSQLKRKTRQSGKHFIKTEAIFSEQELAPFKQDPLRNTDYQGLKQLQKILLEKQFLVERFIRIAAPMRGTALSSKSIDEVVTRACNFLHAIHPPKIVGFRRFISSVAFTFIKKARSVEMMPGIESMMPSSPLIALLNRDTVQLRGELSVIAGESTTAGLIHRLKHQWLTDNIFKEAHDYVVNLSATFGGCLRAEGASRYYLHKNKNIGHFNYFKHGIILQRIEEALTAPLGAINVFTPFSTTDLNPAKEISTSTNQNKSRPNIVNPAINTDWIYVILQNTKQYFYTMIHSRLKANGLVTNTQNQLFYTPNTEGWQATYQIEANTDTVRYKPNAK